MLVSGPIFGVLAAIPVCVRQFAETDCLEKV